MPNQAIPAGMRKEPGDRLLEPWHRGARDEVSGHAPGPGTGPSLVAWEDAGHLPGGHLPGGAAAAARLDGASPHCCRSAGIGIGTFRSLHATPSPPSQVLGGVVQGDRVDGHSAAQYI